MPHNQLLRFPDLAWPMAALYWPRAGRARRSSRCGWPMAGFCPAIRATCRPPRRVLACARLPCARRWRGKWMLAEALRPGQFAVHGVPRTCRPAAAIGSRRIVSALPAGLRPFHQGTAWSADVPRDREPETTMNRELAKSCALALFRRSSPCCSCRPARQFDAVAQSAAADPAEGVWETVATVRNCTTNEAITTSAAARSCTAAAR